MACNHPVIDGCTSMGPTYEIVEGRKRLERRDLRKRISLELEPFLHYLHRNECVTAPDRGTVHTELKSSSISFLQITVYIIRDRVSLVFQLPKRERGAVNVRGIKKIVGDTMFICMRSSLPDRQDGCVAAKGAAEPAMCNDFNGDVDHFLH